MESNQPNEKSSCGSKIGKSVCGKEQEKIGFFANKREKIVCCGRYERSNEEYRNDEVINDGKDEKDKVSRRNG